MRQMKTSIFLVTLVSKIPNIILLTNDGFFNIVMPMTIVIVFHRMHQLFFNLNIFLRSCLHSCLPNGNIATDLGDPLRTRAKPTI